MNLKQFFPTHEAVEHATVRALAGALLKVIVEESGGGVRAFHVGNLLRTVQQLYEVRAWECARAASEALTWLAAQSLICQAPGGASAEHCIPTRAGLAAAGQLNFEEWSAERELPATLLHPDIQRECMDSFRLGKFDTAVFEAFKMLEVAVRDLGGFTAKEYGIDLMRKAFQPDTGPLRDQVAMRSEQEALQHLMAGAIGSYKNPHSHRRVEIGAVEAREMLILASHLLRIAELRSLV